MLCFFILFVYVLCLIFPVSLEYPFMNGNAILSIVSLRQARGWSDACGRSLACGRLMDCDRTVVCCRSVVCGRFMACDRSITCGRSVSCGWSLAWDMVVAFFADIPDYPTNETGSIAMSYISAKSSIMHP